MSYLLAIEGADGAGKATAAENVCQRLRERGLKVAVISFPCYNETVGGFALGEFLSGRIPVPVTPQAAAVLYALDRFESRLVIEEAMRSSDFIIFDRYIGSNVAYQAAKVALNEAIPFMDWIVRLETETFRLHAPNLNIYLDTPSEIALSLIRKKSRRSYTTLTFDRHEEDIELQMRVRVNYANLAGSNLLGSWAVIATTIFGRLRLPSEIASDIVAQIRANLDNTLSPAVIAALAQ